MFTFFDRNILYEVNLLYLNRENNQIKNRNLSMITDIRVIKQWTALNN